MVQFRDTKHIAVGIDSNYNPLGDRPTCRVSYHSLARPLSDTGTLDRGSHGFETDTAQTLVP